jgi:hypothetical protein
MVLRSTLELTRNVDFDATLRFVDDLPTLDYDSYLTVDCALAWHPGDGGLELSLVGQNLFDDPHPEQSFVFSSSGVPTEVERSVFVQVAWNFE